MMPIGRFLSAGGRWLVRNPRLVINVLRFSVHAFVTYRGQKYDLELKELRKQYASRRNEEAKEAAKSMMFQIEDIINNEPDLSRKERKELKKILKENTGWVFD